MPDATAMNYDTPEGAVLRLLLVAGRRVIDHRHRGDSWKHAPEALIAAASRNLAQTLPVKNLGLAHIDLADTIVYAAFAMANTTASSPEECLLRYVGAALRRVVANRDRAEQWREASAEAQIAKAHTQLLVAQAETTLADARDEALADAGVYAAFAAYLLSLEPREESAAA